MMITTRSGIIPLVILLFIVGTSLLFARKANRIDNDIDKMARALTQTRPFIAKGADISFKDGVGDISLFSKARFILAPLYTLHNNNHFDTVLAVYPSMSPDSMVRTLSGSGRNIIWQYSDRFTFYCLSTGKH